MRRPVNSPDFVTVMRSMEKVNIDGDFMEFGVYKGGSLYPILKRANELNRRFFAFDSFAGFPKFDPQINGAANHRWLLPGAFKDTSYEGVKRYISQCDLDINNLHIVPGFFDETLTEAFAQEHNISKVAFAFIDCDLYESATSVLRFLDCYVADGSILAFDDFCRCIGVKQATDEFLTRAKWVFEPLSDCSSRGGRAFVVRPMSC